MKIKKLHICLLLAFVYHMCIMYSSNIYGAYYLQNILFYEDLKENNTLGLYELRLNTDYITNATIYKYISGYRSYNKYICPNLGKDTQLLILVSSALNHAESRIAVRNTWAQYKISKPLLLGFFLGSTTDDNLQKQIDIENEMYRDIIQGNFIDSYSNLTLKSMSILEWSFNYCPKAKFILKVDDDAFVNIPLLLETVNRLDDNAKHIYGQISTKWLSYREVKSKYYLPFYEYAPKILPDFAVGIAYMFPSSIVYDLFHSALNTSFVRLEDVFLTGLAIDKPNITLVNITNFVNQKRNFDKCNLMKTISFHLFGEYAKHFRLWNTLRDNKTVICPK